MGENEISVYSLFADFLRTTCNGIEVKEVDFNYVDGLLKGKRIGIRSDLELDMKGYVLGHEIGHLLLHWGKGEIIDRSDPNYKLYEFEADVIGTFLEALAAFAISKFTGRKIEPYKSFGFLSIMESIK